ncbi:unnamed protein product [Heligmosomoides polygyrus]|uniref:Uncharacterized protein n=1 Tax=Heligmosomoides polygyrus TaxID=6339 RepID=A0A183G5T2_HELPZ|nr:unnamed protein product [Heligmosomoides polygyrus]
MFYPLLLLLLLVISSITARPSVLRNTESTRVKRQFGFGPYMGMGYGGWGRPYWGYGGGWGRPGWGYGGGWGRPYYGYGGGWGRPGWGYPGWGRPGWGYPGYGWGSLPGPGGVGSSGGPTNPGIQPR